MKRKPQQQFITLALVLLFFGWVFPSVPSQLSSNYFFKNYLSNATHIDILDNELAHVFLNNSTKPNYFINITEDTNFEYRCRI